MTRIDFYILPLSSAAGDASGGAVATACKLCDKALASGSRVYIQASDDALADSLDAALWTLRQGGFVSHERYRGEPLEDPQPAVLIGSAEPPDTHLGILINLDVDVPLHFSRFERVLEIVPGQEALRAASRQRFMFYRNRGYEMATHNL